tara:strand:- start:1735 stop:2316 length:582 start_codon:yes stop_codon:yes gene_type:complete
MSYNLKDVFYLGSTHEYPAASYGSAGIEGVIPIDVSAYVDPIAKGRQRGQGLAIYKVHCQMAGDTMGGAQIATDAGAATFGLTVKPYTTTGDAVTSIAAGDLTPESDLAVYLAQYCSPATAAPGQGVGLNPAVSLEPSEQVPYVCVRDTIFQAFVTSVGMSSADSMHISYRLECAMITLDTATLNQLLRTQTA